MVFIVIVIVFKYYAKCNPLECIRVDDMLECAVGARTHSGAAAARARPRAAAAAGGARTIGYIAGYVQIILLVPSV